MTFSFFFLLFFLQYTLLSQREEVPSVPLVEQGMDSSTSNIDNLISGADTYRPPLRPLPYDDPRCSRMQHEGLISRCDKSLSHFCDESEPLRESNNAINMEMSTTAKRSGSIYEVASKLCCAKSSLKNTSAEDQTGVTYTFPSYEDEDVCPTCLEGKVDSFFSLFYSILIILNYFVK